MIILTNTEIATIYRDYLITLNLFIVFIKYS